MKVRRFKTSLFWKHEYYKRSWIDVAIPNEKFLPSGILNLSGPLQLKASVTQMFGWGNSPINNKVMCILTRIWQFLTLNDGTKSMHFRITTILRQIQRPRKIRKIQRVQGGGNRTHISKGLPSSDPDKVYASCLKPRSTFQWLTKGVGRGWYLPQGNVWKYYGGLLFVTKMWGDLYQCDRS